MLRAVKEIEVQLGRTPGERWGPRVIDIDLTAAAFDAENAPLERLEAGILRILEAVSESPSVLRISYFSAGEDPAVIRDRLDQLEDLIQDNWDNIGDYRLIVERDVKYLQ